MMICYLHPKLKPFFTHNEPLFKQLMRLEGITYRQQLGRETKRITLGNKTYFLKQYRGLDFREILKNFLQGRKPILSAKTEWEALQYLATLNIAVPILLGYGLQWHYTPWQQSFVLMQDIEPAISLETLCSVWEQHRPGIRLKYLLLKEIAQIALTLHNHNICHRDFYLCHFLVTPQALQEAVHLKTIKLFLIDLHRATQYGRIAKQRGPIKDLASLYFSSKNIGLTKRDLYRFMQLYRKKPLRLLLKEERSFWEKIKIRGEKLYYDHTR